MTAEPLRVLVVDDEVPALRRLVRLVNECPDARVVGEAQDGEAAVVEAARTQAQVVLLDITMPGVDGLTLAQRAGALPPVIFCTAHDAYALKAFEVNAVDYLLKPVRLERLAAALERARARLGKAGAGQQQALEALAPAPAGRVLSSTRGAVHFFDAAAITRFWASEKYTLFLAGGAEQLTEESLSSLEERLGPAFVRVHRAELVRLSAVVGIKSEDEGPVALLSDGQRVAVSRRSLAGLKQALGL
ncbi:MAG: response regulator transcription factor [Myxococcaceae bacterium]|jgi:DNA-binding LytR/AlgR family response regulator|nr:response regulator transcription factor [Myxococcaceae bacterium]MCA3012245.1 response regulator transcription factor [Myxococcaceae bacterium]